MMWMVAETSNALSVIPTGICTRPEEGVKVLDLTRDLDTDPKERVL